VIKNKIETIARRFGADGCFLRAVAEKQIKDYDANGFGKLPICMRTTLS